MNKTIHKFSQVRDEILKGIDMIAEPIKQTLSPKGRNVIFEDNVGQPRVTNDGVTIARNIFVKEPIPNAIIEMIKYAALKTNNVAGDGTTTVILLTQKLIYEGFKLIDNGWNPMVLKRTLDNLSKRLIDEINNNYVKEIKDDQDLHNIALISSNDDEEIATNVVDAIKKSGPDGLILLTDSPKEESELEYREGFLIENGMYHPSLINQKGKFSAFYRDVKVLVTDKRIYHADEAIAIMKAATSMNEGSGSGSGPSSGPTELVVIARDFIGKSAETFLTNHASGRIKILLIKDSRATDNDNVSLQDLATYLGSELVTEKMGSLVTNLNQKHFATAQRVFADGKRSLILRQEGDNKDLQNHLLSLRADVAASQNDKEKEEVEKRISYLTSGLVDLYIGGKTKLEIMEKIYHYEDAINSTRNAEKEGYVLGGGITLWSAYQTMKKDDLKPDIKLLAEKFCAAPMAQIAENCDIHFPTMIKNTTKKVGYNALTDNYEDLEKAGVIDSAAVIRQSIANSISVAGLILSSGYIIVNEPMDQETMDSINPAKQLQKHTT